MKKKWKILLFIIFIAFITLVAFYFFKKDTYVYVSPLREDVVEAVYALGKVKSHKRYEIITGVISTVKNVFVKEGESISQGQLLLELESGTFFKSPISGTVTSVKLEKGETVLPQISILKVEDLSDCYMEVSLEQEAALLIRPGMEVEVSFENLRGVIFKGKVDSIFPREGEFLSHLVLNDLDRRILPGMNGDVVFKIRKIYAALTLPKEAVKESEIEVFKDNKWKKIRIKIGVVFGNVVQIIDSGLNEKDQIRYKKVQ